MHNLFLSKARDKSLGDDFAISRSNPADGNYLEISDSGKRLQGLLKRLLAYINKKYSAVSIMNFNRYLRFCSGFWFLLIKISNLLCFFTNALTNIFVTFL